MGNVETTAEYAVVLDGRCHLSINAHSSRLTRQRARHNLKTNDVRWGWKITMKQDPSFVKRLARNFRHKGRRRSERLASIRNELQRRGVKVDELSDSEIEAAIASGRRVLGSASVRGSDVTGAFVVLVRTQEKI